MFFRCKSIFSWLVVYIWWRTTYNCTCIISHLDIKVYPVGNMMWFIIVFFKKTFSTAYMYNLYIHITYIMYIQKQLLSNAFYCRTTNLYNNCIKSRKIWMRTSLLYFRRVLFKYNIYVDYFYLWTNEIAI